MYPATPSYWLDFELKQAFNTAAEEIFTEWRNQLTIFDIILWRYILVPTDDDFKLLQAENQALKDTNAALTSEKGKAELDKIIAEVQRATILAQIPPSDTKALEGKVTVDAVATTEIQRLAHVAMSAAIDEMAKEILDVRPKLLTVAIHDQKDMSALGYYTTVMRQLALLVEGYRQYGLDKDQGSENGSEHALAAPPLIGPALVGGTVKSVIDVISLFKTNVEIKGTVVTFDDAAVVAKVANKLRSPKDSSDRIEVIYSTLYLPGILSAPNDEESRLLKTLKDVSAMRQKSEMEVIAFDLKTAAGKAIDPDRGKIAELKALNAGYDKLSTGFGKIDDKENLSALSVLLRGEVMEEKLQSVHGAVLFVKAIGGGENRITQNLFSNGRIYHSGSAILTYLLFTLKDGLILSDVISETTGFREANLIPKGK